MRKSVHRTILLVIILIGLTCCKPMLSQVSYLGKIFHHEDGVYGLTGAMSMCFSIDKKNIYVSGQNSLAVFNYDENTGSEDFVEAYLNKNDGNNELYFPSCVRVSPDDKFVYVSTRYNDCLSLYKRDPNNGTLELLKIFYDNTEGLDGLDGIDEIEISNDGEYLYLVAFEGKISTFSRDTLTGYISHVQSIGTYEEGGMSWPVSLKVSRDNRFVYVASRFDDLISTYEINPKTGELIYLESISAISGQVGFRKVEISYDNNYLYIAGRNSLGIYIRNTQTGKLTLQELFKYDDPGISGMKVIYSITVTPDDKNIYAITLEDTSFVTFSRNISTNEFQFIESKPFLRHYFNDSHSNTAMICDNNYVFGASYWESVVHKTKRNQTDGRLIYEKLIHEGDGAFVDGLYNPLFCFADEQQKMVYVSTYKHGISIFLRNDTTGKLMYKNVANNDNQHSNKLWNITKMVGSKDGNYLYALCWNYDLSMVAIFKVDHATNNLLLIDSVMSDCNGASGICLPRDLALSPDGEHLYVLSSYGYHGIAQFSLNTQNGLLEYENVYENDSVFDYYDNISISYNGKYVFSWGSNAENLTMMSRNESSGELNYLSTFSHDHIGDTYLYGLNQIALSHDNKNLYAVYEDSDVLLNFRIDSINHKLNVLQIIDYETSMIDGLQGVKQIGVRNDGTFVYTSSFENNSLGLFYRDQTNGILTFLKDYTELENNFNGLDRNNGIYITNNDRNLYLISDWEEAVASYSIDLYLGPDRAICDYDSALLDAGKGYSTYRWSTNETTQRIYAKEEGYYHVETTDEFGFVDNDTMYLIVNQHPELDLGPDVLSCYGIPVVLNSGFYGENLWNTGATSASITVDSTGTFSVAITDNHLCKNMDSVNVIFHSLPEVDLGADTTIWINQTLVISVESIPEYEYLWYNGATSSSITINSSSITNNSLQVWLEVTSNFGCKKTDNVLVTVDTTKVYFEPVEIKVDPVPTIGFVNLESNYIITNIDCYDLGGKFLFSKKPNTINTTINAEELSIGIYYLRITLINGFTKTLKIVKI